jgi:hypothetical protein
MNQSTPRGAHNPDKYTDQDWGFYLADCAALGYPILPQIIISHHLQLSLLNVFS